MTKEIISIDPQLAINLKEAKAVLAKAQDAVEAAESAIYLAAGKLPEKGTVHCTGVKISLGFYERWNDSALQNVEENWQKFSNLPFPFKRVYKADGKAVTYIRENMPTAYAVLEPALTLTPKKPSFVLDSEKE